MFKGQSSESQQIIDGQPSIRLQNSIFHYKKYEKTIFVPVYPRAYIQEIIGIDFDRRTVTAHFVVHITVCCNFEEKKLDKKLIREQGENPQDFEAAALKKFIRTHLILQFGYNQTIYIPQIMKQDNPFCIINEVVQSGKQQEYVTYKIRGNLQCSAHFDLMLFPLRQIEVLNHLVIRSQVFRGYQIKYNAMMLKQDNILGLYQFSPHITFPEFAGYRIMHFSTEMATGESKYQLKNIHFKNQFWQYIKKVFNKDIGKIAKPVTISNEYQFFKIIINILNMSQQKSQKQAPTEEDIENLQEISPFKHVVFKFQMMSLKPAFVFQNEVPIWVLAVLSLYTFTSRPDIGNRYGNIVLLIVSYVGLFINFRVNNVGHSSFTFYQIKLIIIMMVPILLIISTVSDYYSNVDSTQTNYALRKSQIQNPFLLASMIIVIVCFSVTALFLILTAIHKHFQFQESSRPRKSNRNDSQSVWQNLIELQWQQPKLFHKISAEIYKSKSMGSFKILDDQVSMGPFKILDHQVMKKVHSFIQVRKKDGAARNNSAYVTFPKKQ